MRIMPERKCLWTRGWTWKIAHQYLPRPPLINLSFSSKYKTVFIALAVCNNDVIEILHDIIAAFVIKFKARSSFGRLNLCSSENLKNTKIRIHSIFQYEYMTKKNLLWRWNQVTTIIRLKIPGSAQTYSWIEVRDEWYWGRQLGFITN